jgi:hypothetical protein
VRVIPRCDELLAVTPRLDYELERDDQRFVQERNRDRSDSDARPARGGSEIREGAAERDLPVHENKVQFPDFSGSNTRPDGRRDIERRGGDDSLTTAALTLVEGACGLHDVRSGGRRVGGIARSRRPNE